MVSKVSGQVMLETKRIILRKIESKDAPTLLRWGQDSVYHKSAGYQYLEDLAAAQRSVLQYQRRPYSYGIELKENNRLVGLVELYERGLDQYNGLLMTKDLGFLLDKDYWHQGLMTEALTLVINFAFEKLHQNQIWAGTFVSNKNSQKLLKKLGFRYVYTTDYSMVSSLFNYQEKYYLLTPQDWHDIMQINMKSQD